MMLNDDVVISVYDMQMLLNLNMYKRSEQHLTNAEKVLRRLAEMKDGVLDISIQGAYDKLTHLPESPLWKTVISLDCSGHELMRLPDLPMCESLRAYSNKLTELPDLPMCKKLNCSDNRLTKLPDLPICEKLLCESNPLERLPELPMCKILDCSMCGLTVLPDLPMCEELDCNSNRLMILPKLPMCKEILCCGGKYDAFIHERFKGVHPVTCHDLPDILRRERALIIYSVKNIGVKFFRVWRASAAFTAHQRKLRAVFDELAYLPGIGVEYHAARERFMSAVV